MTQKSRELFNLWNSNSITYCHWKSNEHLLEGLNGDTDLDVLLSRTDTERGCELLKEAGFIRFKSQFGSRYPNVEDWMGFDETTGRLLHVHLHFALMTGHKGIKEYELPWLEETLSSRKKDAETGVYIMDPSLELMTLYTRLVLKSSKKKIKAAKNGEFKIDKNFKIEIDYIKPRTDWRHFDILLSRYYGDKAAGLLNIVKQEEMDSKSFCQLYDLVTDKMSRYSRYHGIGLPLRIYYYSKAIFLRNALRKRGGWNLITRKVNSPFNSFSVAFIGQDGCGKSTVTLEIESWLNWKIDAKRFYLGSGDHYNSFLKRLLKRGAKYRESSKNKKNNNTNASVEYVQRKKKNIKNFLPAMLVAYNKYLVAQRAYKEVLQSEKYRMKGGIPLFDRFPQTVFEGIYDGPKVRDFYKRTGLDYYAIRLLAKREERLLNKIQQYQPRLVFKLMLPPEESIRRKPFENFEAVTLKHEITKKLEFKKSRVHVVDATQDYQQELLFIKNQIWSEITRIQSL